MTKNASWRQCHPFEGEMLDEIRSFYRISTTWASNALEGNTLTIGETKALLEDGITVGGKPLKDTLEACGHEPVPEQESSVEEMEYADWER